MNKKIIAIGGGENGRLKSDGTRNSHLYETAPMDKEIIKLTGKEKPNFLLIAHSQPLERQDLYFETIKDIFYKKYNCFCKNLKSDKLNDLEYVKKIIEWADIIYEGGGITLDMISLWKTTGFDKILRQAWENGKVMCGISAGANCWFKSCSSDSLKIKYDIRKPFIKVECLGFIDALFVPHCNESGRYDSMKELIKNEDIIALSVSNCAALEIIDDKYRLITSNKQAYGLKSYYKDGKYFEENIKIMDEFKNLKDLLSKY